MIQIRKEQPGDASTVRLVNEEAFGQAQEANIVDKLRQSCDSLVSLVTVVAGRLVGKLVPKIGRSNTLSLGFTPQ